MTHRATIVFFLKITAFSFLVGALMGFFDAADRPLSAGLVLGGLTGFLIGSGCLLFEFAFLSNRSIRWFRKVPAVVIMALRAFAYSVVITIGLVMPSLFLHGVQVWLLPDYQYNFWLSAGIATLISVLIELRQLLGREASVAIFTGRYRRPRLEHRIVMFADLVGSTALAEELGDLRFHELLADVSYDLSAPIEQAGGETHRYIGDAVIVTWSMDNPRNFERSLSGAKGMVDTLARLSKEYTLRYGHPMRIRIALHCGPVAAGEVGDWKKEIALLGDTMNTAARIETAAREYGADIVISDNVKTHLPTDMQATLSRLPDYTARGKQMRLKLWAINTPDPQSFVS